MTIDPMVKDLPIAVVIILFILGMTKLGLEGVKHVSGAVKYVVDFIKSRDEAYNTNTKKLIDDQNEFWRLFSEKQSQVWQGFIRDMIERVGDGQDTVVNNLTDLSASMSKNFRDLTDRIDKIGRDLSEHDKRTHG